MSSISASDVFINAPRVVSAICMAAAIVCGLTIFSNIMHNIFHDGGGLKEIHVYNLHEAAKWTAIISGGSMVTGLFLNIFASDKDKLGEDTLLTLASPAMGAGLIILGLCKK